MPTPFLPSGLPLPYYARVDLAYLDAEYFVNITPGLVVQTTPPAGTLMVIPYARWTITTDATVADRTIIVQYRDSTGAPLWTAPADFTVPASTSAAFTFLTGIGSSYHAGTTGVIVGPDTVMLPSDHIRFDSFNWQAGDQITALNFSRFLIPTGPEPADTTVTVQPVLLS